MKYPRIPDLEGLSSQIRLYSQLKNEQGAAQLEPILRRAERELRGALKSIQRRPDDKKLAAAEPNSLRQIQSLRPRGPRRIWDGFDAKHYAERVEGALLGRCAGCTLGAIVEGWPIWRMQSFAQQIGNQFPPVDYWTEAWNPYGPRYGPYICNMYTRNRISGVPVDDDIAYTLLGLLIVEEYGPNFTVEDVGKAWVKYLPMACTAEKVALENLKAGVPAKRVAVKDNPYCQWIGADIRSDPWGYMAPGYPQRAAEMAYHDAYISHRRNGIYGEMFFSAAIAAAFTVDDPIEAIRIGLTEIPKDCLLAKDVKWALRTGPTIKHYQQARDAVDKRFAGMNWVHTNNNACLTIFGLFIGGLDVTKVIGQTVAMGMDNDCTAATAGSLVGAVVGKKGVPAHWYKNFNDKVYSYLIGRESFKISQLVKRFAKQAKGVFGEGTRG